MSHASRIILGVAALLPAASLLAGEFHADSDRDVDVRVDVVADMTEAGRLVTHPTRDKPAYYLPLPVGYQEEGQYQKFFREPPPPTAEIQGMIAKALANQGYRVATGKIHPSLIIAFRWGYWAPIIFHGHFFNQVEMETLVAGVNADYMTPRNPRARDVYEAAYQPRWGMIVTAFDFDDRYYRNKTTILWRAYVSTELWGHYIDEVLPTLIAAGAPLFGRMTTTPQLTHTPVVPEGHVTVGAPYVRSDNTPVPALK